MQTNDTIRPYYTICTYDVEQKRWYDEFGSYSKNEVNEERVSLRDHYKARHIAIIRTNGTTDAMIAARDALPHPKP